MHVLLIVAHFQYPFFSFIYHFPPPAKHKISRMPVCTQLFINFVYIAGFAFPLFPGKDGIISKAWQRAFEFLHFVEVKQVGLCACTEYQVNCRMRYIMFRNIMKHTAEWRY